MRENYNISVKRFNEFANEYAEGFMNVEDYASHIEQFCNLIKIKNPKILELGCGPGNVTRHIRNRFPDTEITAIDLAPRMIEIARKMLPDVNFRLMDIRDICHFTEKFDAILCSFCLPFLSKTDTSKLMADCSNNIQNRGVIYVSAMEGDETQAGFETTSFTGNAQVYFNYHRREDLEKLLCENNFELVYSRFQDYYEPNGSVSTDMIFIGIKTER